MYDYILNCTFFSNVLPSSDLDVGSELTEDLALSAASLIAIQSNSSKSLRLLPQHLAKHLNKKQLGAKLDLVQQIQCIAKAMTYITGHPLVKIFLDTLGNSTNKGMPFDSYLCNLFVKDAEIPLNLNTNQTQFTHFVYGPIYIFQPSCQWTSTKTRHSFTRAV